MTAANSTHVQGQTLSHQIRETIARQIVSGELEPGERLVETRLATAFGTSQAPVREALRELKTFGLVEVRPRRGTFVQPFVHQTLHESYVVRAALEETATRLVLIAQTVPTAELRVAVETMYQAAKEGDAESLGSATVCFHHCIVDAADNELLKQSWSALQIEARTSIIMMTAEQDLRTIADDHQQLLASLTADDINVACTQAWSHQWRYANVPHDPHDSRS